MFHVKLFYVFLLVLVGNVSRETFIYPRVCVSRETLKKLIFLCKKHCIFAKNVV